MQHRLPFSVPLLITGAATLTLACIILPTRTRNEALVASGYTNLWSAHAHASADFREALRRNPASPYRWSDLAEALFHEGDASGAQYCIRQAVELGPHVPAILLRAANLQWLLNHPELTVTYSRQILALTAQYDPVIFATYERMGLSTSQILNTGLPAELRGAQSYFRHLLISDKSSGLEPAWQWMRQHNYIDQGLANDYARYLTVKSRQLVKSR